MIIEGIHKEFHPCRFKKNQNFFLMHVEFVKIIFWGYAQTITVLLKGGGVSLGTPRSLYAIYVRPL